MIFAFLRRSRRALTIVLRTLYLGCRNFLPMRVKSGHTPAVIHVVPGTYKEDFVNKYVEPKKRELRIILSRAERQHHVKVTFYGTLSAIPAPFPKTPIRREDFVRLCLSIDFQTVHLLDDTVTELVIEYLGQSSHQLCTRMKLESTSQYAPIASGLRYRAREDTTRVRYPLYLGNTSLASRDLSEITKIKQLAPGTYLVQISGDKLLYVYKEVERPHYRQSDSHTIEQELKNLEQLLGAAGIVQLVAPVTSVNPYQTTRRSSVLRGFVLEYHSGGTLLEKLQRPSGDTPWCYWACQLVTSLSLLHRVGITHMDLKPENVVIDPSRGLVLIDISGIGGTTREWLSPDMQLAHDPIKSSFKERQQNDVWAVGKIIQAMSEASCYAEERQALRHISLRATANVSTRASLESLIQNLSEATPLSLKHSPDHIRR